MAENNPFAKKRSDEEIASIIDGDAGIQVGDDGTKAVPHKFNIGIAILVWVGVSVITSVYEVFSMYYSDPTIFEEFKGVLIAGAVISSMLIGTISVFVNWVVSSLIFLGTFKIGKNEVTYRAVLYHYLKNAWFYAVWSAINLVLALILKSPNFLTSVPGVIITAICLGGFYAKLYLDIRKDFKLNKGWIYIVVAVLFLAITLGSLIYMGTDSFSNSLISNIGG